VSWIYIYSFVVVIGVYIHTWESYIYSGRSRNKVASSQNTEVTTTLRHAQEVHRCTGAS
jgi:hypothetical protein